MKIDIEIWFSLKYSLPIMSNTGVKRREKGENCLKSCQGERQDHFMMFCQCIING